ncbi:MAG: hypothetical protein ACREIC_09255 [Limisphaerales bacterium]
MQRAFVLQLRPETNVEQGRFEGRIEHVDSGWAMHFRTIEEFLKFVEQSLSKEKQRGEDQ